MGRDLLRAVATAAVLTGFALGPTPALADTPQLAPYSSTAQSEECRDLNNINTTRAKHGLGPLRGLQMDLTYYGRKHARDMAARGELWHDMAALKTALPAGWNRYGENVAYHSQGIDAIHQGYLNSPPHRANILDPRYTAVGIGVWHDNRGTVWNSEEFVGGRTGWPVLDCSRSSGGAPSPRTTTQQAATPPQPATSPKPATPKPATSPQPATTPRDTTSSSGTASSAGAPAGAGSGAPSPRTATQQPATSPKPATPKPATPKPTTSPQPATTPRDTTSSSGTAPSAGAPAGAGSGAPSPGGPSRTGASPQEGSAAWAQFRTILANSLAWLAGIFGG